MTDRASISLMKRIIDSYRNDPKWDNAPLGKIKGLSNSHVGSIGQDFVRKWCTKHRLEWEAPASPQSPWDLKIEGAEFEIKTATEDRRGVLQFNHIRHHRQYQAVLCIGICPGRILFDAWRKGDLAEGKAGRLVTMDKGSSATFKLTRKATSLRPISEFVARVTEIAESK